MNELLLHIGNNLGITLHGRMGNPVSPDLAYVDL